MVDIHKKKNLIFYIGIILLVLIGVIAFFDKGLAVGLFLLGVLTAITFLLLPKIGIKDKTLFSLFLIAILIHVAAVLFIYFTEFRPFGGGADYERYHQTAIEISQRFRQGNFSLEGLHISHYFPVVVGIIYIFTLPEMIVGQLFVVWLAALSCLLTYLIILEIGSSKNWAFLIGLIVSIYPSYLYYGSLLLKDTLVIPLALTGMLLTLKLIKNFSCKNFLIFYPVLASLIHFRFYVGHSLLFTFILCWLLISNLNLRKRLIYGIIIIPLLGFLPQISGHGYYGIKPFKHYLTPETIARYRETYYAPPSAPTTEAPTVSSPPTVTSPPPPPSGTGSTVVVETGLKSGPFKLLKNSLISFIYALLGPFPWQIKNQRQLFALFETIPWYFLFPFIAKGALISIKRYRLAIPLLMFALISLAALSLFITNFGIITRIRIPSFIALLCLIPLSFNLKDQYLKKVEDYLSKLWQNI